MPIRRSNKKPRNPEAEGFGLDRDVLRFNRKDDAVRLSDLAGSSLIIGDSGSGKTTGPFYTLAASLMGLGCGLLATAVKQEDAERVRRLASRSGRRDVRVFTLGVDTFNPLLHEQVHGARFGGHTERLVELAMEPLRREGNSRADPLWTDLSGQLIRACVILFTAAEFALSFRLLNEAIHSIPRDHGEARDPGWQDRSPLFRAARSIDLDELGEQAADDVRQALECLFVEFPGMPEKTLGSVITTATSGFGPLLYGEVGRAVNADTNTIDPLTVTRDSGVVILDCPVLLHGEAAATVQRLFVTSAQQELLRRRVTPETPLAIILIDEFPSFGDAERDGRFMSVCRSSRASMVLVAQDVGGVRRTARGARNPKAVSDTVLGLPVCKIFASTSDPETHRYAEAVFTQTPQTKVSHGLSRDEGGRPTGKNQPAPGKASQNASFTRELRVDTAAHELRSLKRGGPENGFRMEAIIGVGGRTWSNGRPSLRVTFDQIFP